MSFLQRQRDSRVRHHGHVCRFVVLLFALHRSTLHNVRSWRRLLLLTDHRRVEPSLEPVKRARLTCTLVALNTRCCTCCTHASLRVCCTSAEKRLRQSLLPKFDLFGWSWLDATTRFQLVTQGMVVGQTFRSERDGRIIKREEVDSADVCARRLLLYW